METIKKVINDLNKSGIEVIGLESVHVFDKNISPIKNLKGYDVEVGGKMVMEIKCVVPIQA